MAAVGARIAYVTGAVGLGILRHARVSVVLGTLVVQGMTLRPLLSWLRLEDDGSVEREVRFARVETLRAANSALDSLPPGEVSEVLRRRYALLLTRTEALVRGNGAADSRSAENAAGDTAIVRAATVAERRSLIALRSAGTIGDEAFQRIEQELDLEEPPPADHGQRILNRTN